MLTVDTPVGRRAAARRPQRPLDPARAQHCAPSSTARCTPNWWFDLLTTEPLTFSTLETVGTPEEMINRVFDPALTIDDVEWLRGAWPGKLVIKGVQSVEDALRVVDAGADGVLLSNHGGRQLDRAPVPLELVEPTVQALGGRAEVLVDTGITNGGDVVAAVALGASAALVGRAYLYGLMAGGRAGVAKVAEILQADVVRTLQLAGRDSVDELGPQHVRLRREP